MTRNDRVVDMSKKYNVAVVGATGLVGETMISILEERKFPVDELHLLASSRSAGETLKFGKRKITVRGLSTFDFKGVDIGLVSAGGSVSGGRVEGVGSAALAGSFAEGGEVFVVELRECGDFVGVGFAGEAEFEEQAQA